MTESLTKHERTLSAVIHASTFSRFFIPFGNIILPLVLWLANRKEYAFVDYNGKQALNFQISLFLYSVIFGAISIPFFFGLIPDFFQHGIFEWRYREPFEGINFFMDWDDFPFHRLWPVGLAGLVPVALFVINVVYTILATLRTHEGQVFKYPITINFIRS
ncbi:DUF4870 domain-containing protein [Muriicola sp.]|uniref:DUF4870 domain-containing protein n=1 Tax=Muriicola sp. TaxID=2020856 RepID=UPI0035628EAA